MIQENLWLFNLYCTGEGRTKLLESLPMKTAKGKETGDATFKVLQDWEVLDNIGSCSFDTTAANTGHLTAAIVTLQNHLARPLLWLSCRHHVLEVVLDHVWKGLGIELPTSPQFEVFKAVRPVINESGQLSSKDCVFHEPNTQYHQRLHGEVTTKLLKLS